MTSRTAKQLEHAELSGCVEKLHHGDAVTLLPSSVHRHNFERVWVAGAASALPGGVMARLVLLISACIYIPVFLAALVQVRVDVCACAVAQRHVGAFARLFDCAGGRSMSAKKSGAQCGSFAS